MWVTICFCVYEPTCERGCVLWIYVASASDVCECFCACALLTCVLFVCCVRASILYEACVTVCLLAHEQVCMAYLCQVYASAHAFVYGVLMCVFCLWYALVRVVSCTYLYAYVRV